QGPVICAGYCMVERRGVLGEGPCDGLHGARDAGPPTLLVRCAAKDGLFCDRTANVCAATLPAGEYCRQPNACDEDSICRGGLCEALRGDGETCGQGNGGLGGFCQTDLGCDVGTLKCGPPLSEGSTCRVPRDCASGVCTQGACAKPEFARSLR